MDRKGITFETIFKLLLVLVVVVVVLLIISPKFRTLSRTLSGIEEGVNVSFGEIDLSAEYVEKKEDFGEVDITIGEEKKFNSMIERFKKEGNYDEIIKVAEEGKGVFPWFVPFIKANAYLQKGDIEKYKEVVEAISYKRMMYHKRNCLKNYYLYKDDYDSIIETFRDGIDKTDLDQINKANIKKILLETNNLINAKHSDLNSIIDFYPDDDKEGSVYFCLIYESVKGLEDVFNIMDIDCNTFGLTINVNDEDKINFKEAIHSYAGDDYNAALGFLDRVKTEFNTRGVTELKRNEISLNIPVVYYKLLSFYEKSKQSEKSEERQDYYKNIQQLGSLLKQSGESVFYYLARNIIIKLYIEVLVDQRKKELPDGFVDDFGLKWICYNPYKI